jgi:hypothetical protein
MRGFQWSLLVLFLVLLGAPASVADEGEARHGAATVAEKALSVLKLRLDARIKEGEVLAKAGRLEEALEAYRSVGELYERGMVDVRNLVAALSKVPASPAKAPFAPDGPELRGGLGGAFSGRAGQRKSRESPKAKEAVNNALRWLAAHQSPNGLWSAADFGTWCDGRPVADASKRPAGAGQAANDVGVSGLALLAFLGAGHTQQGGHPYAKVVSRGLRGLKNAQDPEGCFGPRSSQQFIYGHATSALAMIEAYGMTGSPVFKGSAQRALDFIAASQNPYLGWRYGVRPGDNDTSVTTWMVMCLKSAAVINQAALKRGKPAPLKVDLGAFKGARTWIEKVTDPHDGRVGYNQRGSGPARAQEMIDRFPADKSEAMTAAGMLVRIFTGEDPRKSRMIQLGAGLCSKLPPVWNPSDGSIDMTYWYYGTLAMFQVGGKHWQAWSSRMDAAMLRTQRADTEACGYKGSWDPIGPWGPNGGRVYSTAMMCLCLQVYYRYDKVFKGDK